MSNIGSTIGSLDDNQCMLQRTHINDHKLPPKETDHKCIGTLECLWCGGYILKAFDRCRSIYITIQIWVNTNDWA